MRSIFLPQSAQRLSSSTRGFEFFTSEGAEVFSVNSVSSLRSLRLLNSFTTEDAAFLLGVLCVSSVFSAVTVVLTTECTEFF